VADPGTKFRFVVTIDGKQIGDFTALEGLSAEYDVMPYSEGGENGFEHRLPGQLKYSTIKLSRPLDANSAPNGGGLAAWFTTLGRQSHRADAARTASIAAYDPAGEQITSWNLVDAYPFRWTGPSFSSDGNAVATETLELAHHGFIDS
jgi:phage tail-like protein